MPVNRILPPPDNTNYGQITIGEMPNFQLDQAYLDQLYAQLQANAEAFGSATYFWSASTLDSLVKLKPKTKLNLPDWW
jgi:hypothetical protein